MFVESLENRRLLAGNAVAAAAQAGTVADLATSNPGAVVALAVPAGPTVAADLPVEPPVSPAPSNAVAKAALAGTVATTAQADGQAVAALARGS